MRRVTRSFAVAYGLSVLLLWPLLHLIALVAAVMPAIALDAWWRVARQWRA